MKTAEEILKECSIDIKELKKDKPLLFDRLLLAMEKYAIEYHRLPTKQPKNLKVIRKSDNKIFDVLKYIHSDLPDDKREHIWCLEWKGHHIIGDDCDFFDEKDIHIQNLIMLIEDFSDKNNPIIHSNSFKKLKSNGMF
jgi:hypothetical protein